MRIYSVIRVSINEGDVDVNVTPCSTLAIARKRLNEEVDNVVNANKKSRFYKGDKAKEWDKWFEEKRDKNEYMVFDKYDDFSVHIVIDKSNLEEESV